MDISGPDWLNVREMVSSSISLFSATVADKSSDESVSVGQE